MKLYYETKQVLALNRRYLHD